MIEKYQEIYDDWHQSIEFVTHHSNDPQLTRAKIYIDIPLIDLVNFLNLDINEKALLQIVLRKIEVIKK